MQFSKEAKQYILQCQLIELDEHANESKNCLEPVNVESQKELEYYLAQRRTVILNGLIMSSANDQTCIKKPKCLRLDGSEIEKINEAISLIQRHIDCGSLERVMQLLRKDAEISFEDYEEVIEPPTKRLITKKLNEIEARTSEYPFISAKQAADLLGDVNATNPSRLIAQLKKERKIIGFYFGNSSEIQIPAFQFNRSSLGVHKPVEKLCHTLDHLNDWGVYKWLTTYDEDLKCTPAQAISRPALEKDLLYLAGIFKSESTLRDSIFTSEENNAP
ncbi:hypothetical protein QTO05_22085 [Vibrio fortis]|uniref:hypothetical protein n=1 Tax=Vibrio fortis TaxID=212667 RepID=UPI002F3E873E